MKILVTGGTGFLGARLIPKLVESGHTVFALTRSASSHDKLRAVGVTPIEGDLEGRESLSRSTLSCMRPRFSALLGRGLPISVPMSSAQPRS